MYPEWIQEQLDKLLERPAAMPTHQAAPDQIIAQLRGMEVRIIRCLSERLDRIEAKLDRLLAFCEGD